MKVPWRRVASWHCTACGKCCRAYRVKLSAYEYLKLRHTGFVEERNGRFYIRKIDGRCPFQLGNLCMLQDSLKPMACRLFPFSIRERGDEAALFEYGGEEYYIYVDTFCPNVKLKEDARPSKTMIPLLVEVVRLHRREVSKPSLLTADLGIRVPQRRHRHPLTA